MNKYSSKAVKTAATVGMSLAMVLGNVAPVLAANITSSVNYCVSSDVLMGKDLINAIKADIKADTTLNNDTKTTTVDNIKTGDTVANWTRVNALLPAGSNISGGLDAVLADPAVSKYIVNLTLCSEDSDEKELAKRLIGSADTNGNYKNFAARVTDLKKAIGTLYTNFNETNGTYDGKDLTSTDYNGTSGMKALYDQLVDLGGLKGNIVSNAQPSLDNMTYEETYDELFDKLESAIKDYEETYNSDFADKFVRGLDEADVAGVNVRELVEKDAHFDYNDLSKLEDFISDLKKDKDLYGNVKYSSVKDDVKVAEYVEGLETIVEEIKEVKTLLKSQPTKDIKKATGLNALASAAETYKEHPNGNNGGNPAISNEDAYEAAFNAVRVDAINTITEYVDDFLSEFFTVKAVKRSNGNYTLELEDGTYGRYVTSTDSSDFNQDVITLLTTNVDPKTEDSVYDALTDGVTDLDALIKAATTDIEGLTFNTNITSAQANKIVKAKKAYDDLMDEDGPYYHAMTSKERRAVKANGELIDALYKKMLYTGVVTQSGWVDKGNGDWDYINEDGTRSTKWVAAGSDWYYVKNGTMLRNSWIASDAQGTRWYYVDNAGKMVSNTTVNGYTFNSYGVWVK